MIIRQGDILFQKIGDDVFSDTAELIVGHGEVTGHKHLLLEAVPISGDKLAWDLFARTGEGEEMIFSTPGTDVVHEEHDTLYIPAGTWRVVRQREYTPQVNRFVAD